MLNRKFNRIRNLFSRQSHPQVNSSSTLTPRWSTVSADAHITTEHHRYLVGMETLPPEMVEEIGQYLTPQDLASCSAVCRSWHDTFNNDSLWQRHCDPSLAEPLRKTPCVVEPRFVTPEVENSTLTPISHWRMAFLREQHLWKNYKWGKHKKHELQSYNYERNILSNTLLVRCLIDKIEIWDISTVPASYIASVNVEGLYYCKVYKTNRLLVSDKGSVKVFRVDPSENNVIELIHDVAISRLGRTDNVYVMDLLNCVNGSIYIYKNCNGLTLDVIDLEKGMKIKTESIPVMRIGNQNATIVGIKSSTNSEYVIVIVHVPWSIGEEYHSYVYSVGQLAFSSGPIFRNNSRDLRSYAINGDYLAYSNGHSLKIYNCVTFELVSERPSHHTTQTTQLSCNYYNYPHDFNDGFVCPVHSVRNIFGSCMLETDIWTQNFLEMFSLTSKTWTTVCHNSLCSKFCIRIINNKFIEGINKEDLWEASGGTLKRSHIPGIYSDIINESFTRGISCNSVYYYW